jgi:hypothetical protein
LEFKFRKYSFIDISEKIRLLSEEKYRYSNFANLNIGNYLAKLFSKRFCKGQSR